VNIDIVRRKHERNLLSLPNVVGVGVGERNGKPVIKVLVSRRLPADSLPPESVIPRILDGFDVDVEEVGHISTNS